MQGVFLPGESIKYADSLDSRDVLVGIGALVRASYAKVRAAGSDIAKDESRRRGIREGKL